MTVDIAPPGMRALAGGHFWMGSDDHYPDAATTGEVHDLRREARA